MKVTRIIDGTKVTIVLTKQELQEAYYVQEHEFDKDDVVEALNDMSDEEIAENGFTREFMMTDAVIENIALRKRWEIDKYGTDWKTALDTAFEAFFSMYSES